MIDLFTFKIIIFVSTIVWLFPPIKQFKGPFFLFFLLLGISDPIAYSLTKVLGIYANQVYTLIFMLLPISLFNLNKISIKLLAFSAVLIITGIYTFCNVWEYAFLYHTIVCAIILVIFIKITFVNVAETGKLNIFHLFLILYMSSMFLKGFFVLINLSTGAIYYGVTSIFQILLALFFASYRSNNPILLISLRRE